MRQYFSGRRLADHWPLLIFVLLLLINIGLKGRYTLFDLRSMCGNALPLALIALGQYFVVTCNRIDLSLGPIASLAGASVALLAGHNLVLALIAAIMIGAVAGLINGVLVARFRFPSIIVTLATMSIWQGVALIVLPNPGGFVPPEVQNFMTRGIAFPPMAMILLVLAIFGGAWVMSTRFGLHLRAIGGDEAAAAMSGVPTMWVTTGAFVLGGLMASLGGIYLALATASGSPTTGNDFILSSIATVVIGGVALSGGRGRPSGVVIGALVLTVVGSLLYFSGISSFYQSMITGIILVAVAAGNSIAFPKWRSVRAAQLHSDTTVERHGS
jgi:ribose transport system permease protein